MSQKDPASEPPPKKKRWRRRLFLAALSFFLLPLLLLLLAPSLALNGFVERRAAALVGDRIGRPVTIEGIRIGWLTSIRVDRLEIPAIEGEEGLPAFSLTGVRGTFSLGRIFRGLPIRFGELEVAAVEANMIRQADGLWNFDAMMQNLAGEEAEEEPEPEPEAEPEPSGEAPKFPVDFSRIEIRSMNFRAIDRAEGLRAGYENGAFALTWTGGTTPLQLNAGGEFRAGENLMPWDVQGEVQDWIDGDRRLRLDAARVAVQGGAGAASPTGTADAPTSGTLRAGGEFRIAASLVEGDGGEAVGRLPLKPWADWAKGIPAAAEIPEIDGQIDLDASFKHQNKLKRWEAEAAVLARASARMMMEGEEKILPEQRAELRATTVLDLDKQRVETVDASLRSTPANGTVTGRAIALDDFGKSEALDAKFAANLGEAAHIGAQFMQGEDVRLLEAAVGARASLVPSEDGEKRLTFELDFSPERLITLGPFAEDPPWLADGPLKLDSLGFTWKGEAAAAPGNEKFRVELAGTRGDVFALGPTRADYAKSEEAWSARTEAKLNITRAFDDVLERIVGASLDDLAGKIDLKAEAQGKGEGPITSRGNIELAELSLKLPEKEARFGEPMTSVAWDLGFESSSKRLTITQMELQNSFLRMKAGGVASEKSIQGIRADGRFDLNALAERLVAFLELQTPPGGVVEFSAGADGEIGKSVVASLKLATPEPIVYAQPELVQLSLPIDVEAGATVTWAEEKPQFVDWKLARAQVGDILEAVGEGRLGLGEQPRIDADLSGKVAFTPAVAMIDPVFWEQRNLAAVVEGGAQWQVHAAGPLSPGAEGGSKEALELKGRLQTNVDYAEAASGPTSAAVEAFSDDRNFTVTLKSFEAEQIVYRDRGVTQLTTLQTSLGASMSGLKVRMAADAPVKGTARLKLDALTLDSAQYTTDTISVQLPPLRVSGAFAVDPATIHAEARKVSAEIEGLASMNLDATYGGEDKTWAAKMNAKLGPLESVFKQVQFGGEAPPTIPELSGNAEIALDFHGTVPGQEFDPLEGLPAEGRLTASWSDLGVRQGEALAVQDGEGKALLIIAPGGKALQGELSMGVGRVEMEALKPKALEGIRMAAAFGLEDMNRARFTLDRLEVPSLGFAASAKGSADGLKRVLKTEEALQPGDYLHLLTIGGELHVEEALGELAGLREGLSAGGKARVHAKFHNEADRALSFASTLEFEAAQAGLAEVFELSGITGSWTAGKTLPLRKGLVTPKSPEVGRVRAEKLHVLAKPFDVEALGNNMTFQGFQSGFTMAAESENMIGGPATMRGALGMKGGDPALSGRVQVTGLDLGRLAVQLRDLKGPEAEINGVAEFEWKAPESTEGGLLNGVTVQAASSRIGKRALQRMLEALDPNQEDPRIQKAITGLSLGRPRSVNLELRDSLLTFGAELEMLGGVTVPLPIIERQSLGEAEQVYKLDEYAPMVGMARTGLLLLLSPDFETFERHLNELEAAP